MLKEKKQEPKYNPKELFLETSNYNDWSDKEESVDLSDMPPIERDEEVKEVRGLKFVSPNKLLTRLPILLAQIKAENNSNKLKSKTR